MAFKSQATKEAIKEIKKEKENTEMNKSNVKTIVITVAVTLASVAALVGSFYIGTQFQNSQVDQMHLELEKVAGSIVQSSKK